MLKKHYRPQRSWGKAVFTHVCNSVNGGEGACVVARGHAWLLGGGGGACVGYDEIRLMSGRYASYWNAFLYIV